MVRQYSALMALLGIIVVVLRGIKDGAGVDGTLVSGLVWMVLLGSVGMLVAAIAQSTVDESVRVTLETELSVQEQGDATSATAT